LEALSVGLEGKNVVGMGAKEDLDNLTDRFLSKATTDHPDNVLGMIERTKDLYGNIRNKITSQMPDVLRQKTEPYAEATLELIDNAAERAKNFNPSKMVELKRVVENTFYNFSEEGDRTIKRSVPVRDLIELKSYLRSLSKYGDQSVDDYTRALATKLSSSTGHTDYDKAKFLGLDQVNLPGISQFIEELVPGYHATQYNPLQNLNRKLSVLEEVEDLFPSLSAALGSEKLGSGGASARQAVDLMLNALKRDPELEKTLGAKINSTLKEVGRMNNLVQHTQAAGLSHGFVADTARGTAMAGANIAGMTLNVLRDMTPEALRGFARALALKTSEVGEDVAVQKLASILERAADRDTIGRNALLFAVQQNPAYRKVLHESLPSRRAPQKVEKK
jgi:hypothetical protein